MRSAHKRSLANARKGIYMDADQVHRALRCEKGYEQQAIDYEQIGFAQFYCVECAQYFADDNALKGHKRGSRHKKRLKVRCKKYDSDIRC